MGMTRRPDVEGIPADLDRFLGSFFDRGGWRSEIKYDPLRNQLYLDITLASRELSGDDRFLSLVEYFARAQDRLLRQGAGLPLQCRLFGDEGDELTAVLHHRGSSYLDDNDRGTRMRRRLAWLSFRRRLVARILPGALLWSVALLFVVTVVGVTLSTAIVVALCALLVQLIVLYMRQPDRR